MAMTKKMFQSCVRLVNNCTAEESKGTGAFYDKEENNILCIIGKYGGCKFTDLSKDEEQKILNICSSPKAGSFSFVKMFQPLFNKEDYPDDWNETINIDDMQKLVTSAKKTDDWKIYASQKVMLQRNFNSCYDRRLFLEVAKCIDSKQVVVHFPSKRNKPIILIGKYGMGMLLPIMF